MTQNVVTTWSVQKLPNLSISSAVKKNVAILLVLPHGFVVKISWEKVYESTRHTVRIQEMLAGSEFVSYFTGVKSIAGFQNQIQNVR